MAETTDKRTSGTDILTKIAKVASSTLELREVLDTILEVIADGLSVDLCSICLLKPDNKILCLEAEKGAKKENLNAFCIKDEDELVKRVSQNMQPLIVDDISSDAEINRIINPEFSHILSLLAVPILRDNKPLGIVMVQTKHPHKYGQEEIDILTIISHNISAAIMNAELYRSVKSQLDELKVIHEIGKAITSILNIDDLLPYICREVSKVFNVRGCILRLIEGDVLHTKASYGLPDEIRHDITLEVGKGPAGQVALSGDPLLISDMAEVSGALYFPGVEATTVICVPLIFGEKTLGTLELFDKKDEWGVTPFDENDLNTLLTFASASSIAIENARRYRAETEKEKEVSQTKEYLASLINDSADAIIITDMNGNIASWNRGAENIYGYTEDEVKGTFLPMVPSFLIDEERNVINSIKNKETLRNIETIRQTKNGRLIEVSLTLSPIIDHAGNVTGISGISRDISEKKMVEKELIRKNQELSRLFFINSVVRSTLKLDKLLKMVLTVVTMGDGLGFNRAVLFLVDESDNTLNGVMGVGPASPEEAKDIWISMEGKSLGAIIEEIEKGPFDMDSHLDRLSQSIKIDIDNECILCRSVKEKRPFNIQSARTEALVPPALTDMFGTDAFGIVPLISRDKVIGLIWVDNLFTGRPIKDEDLQFLMGFSSHIASAIENARLFENVSLARAELKNIFESISDMVYFTDSDLTIRRINEAVVKKIGKPEDEIIGRKCYEVFHGRSEPWEKCPHHKSMEHKKSFVGEIEDPYLEGTFIVSNSPIFDSSENFVGTVHISRDITDQKALRERVIHSERMAALGELAARVAHEIRNPLISIGGFARRLEKRLTDDTKEYAKIIVNEVTRLENILKEILGFVKSSKVMRHKANINEVLEEIVNFMTPEILEKKNTIQKDLCGEPLMASIDNDRIKEAILNLITNAAHATNYGAIVVKTETRGSEAIIEISDTGCGIKQEDIKNIFNPFFTTKSQGTGLGLAVTHKIIQEHNGKIEVESSVGGGSVFKIHLPLDES